EQLGRVQAQQVAVLALVEPQADVAQGLERPAIAALGALRPARRSPQTPELTREERNDLIGFTQAVGPEHDGFCFAQGHLRDSMSTRRQKNKVSISLRAQEAKNRQGPTRETSATQPGARASRPHFCSGKSWKIRSD